MGCNEKPIGCLPPLTVLRIVSMHMLRSSIHAKYHIMISYHITSISSIL